jgi:predicted  nucleic acid-binding Zn-ribbon protein
MDKSASSQPHEQLLKQLQSVQSEIEAAAGRAKETELHQQRIIQQNADLQARIQSLTKERDEARLAAEKAVNEGKSLHERVELIGKENATFQSRIDALTRERDELRDEALAAIEESDVEVQDVQKRLQAALAEANQAKTLCSKLSQERDQLREELKSIAPEREQLRAAATKAQNDATAAVNAAQAAEVTFKQLQSQVVELEKQLRNQESQAEEQFKRTLKEKEEILQARNRELEAARKAAHESLERVQSSAREVEAIRLDRKKLEDSLLSAKADTDAARQAKSDLEKKLGELSVKEAEARHLQAARDQAQTKLASMEGSLVALQQEKSRLAAALEKVKEDAAGQLTIALQQKDAEFRSLEARLAAQAGEIESLQKQLDARARQIESEEAKSRALEAQLNRFKAQSKEEEADWHQALETVEQYRAQVESAAKRQQELESELIVKQRELAARVQEAAVFKDQLATLQGTLSMMKSEVLQLRTHHQPNREMDFLLTGITLLAQQARTGSADFRSVLKVLLEEGDKRVPESRTPVSSAPAQPIQTIVPRTSVEITPPSLIPGGSPVFATTGHHLRQLELVDLPGDIAISLDELACAVKDSTWRAKWAAGEKPNVFQGATAAARGKAEEIFHLVTREFSDWLVQPDGVTDPQSFGEKELWSTMYELFAAERLDRMVQRNDFDGANYLSRRLRTFCRRLEALKQRTRGFSSWNDVLLPTVRTLQRVVFPLQERRLIIQGILYGLRSHPESNHELADWQTEAETSEGQNLDVLALTALIFHKAHPEAPFHPVLEHYTQDFSAREVSRADLNRALRERVVPVFYDLAGMPQPASLTDARLDFFPAAHSTEVLHG